jgi:hypothetical protein
MSADDYGRAETVVVEAVLPAVEAAGGAIVDGGTDAGVMRVVGTARAARGSSFALVGVVGAGTIAGGDGTEPDTGESLEPNHTLVIVVPGQTWGDEGPWIFHTADLIAGDRPIVTVLLNGGNIAWNEVEESLRRHQPIIAVGGTGRAADALAQASGGSDLNVRATSAYDSGLIEVVDASEPERLAKTLEAALTAEARMGEI